MLKKHQQGQVLIISVIFFTIILVLVASLMQYVLQNTRASRLSAAGEQALQLTDAGIDRALQQLNTTAGTYSGETGTVLGEGTFDVSVAALGSNREITVTAYIPSSASPVVTKQVKVRATIDTTTVVFNYGVHIGDGGLQMDNNSRVNGNAYSNGDIIGANGAVITGTAIVAGATGKIDNVSVNGNATGHFLEDIAVGGDSNSASLLRATVTGRAVSDSISNCTVGGSATYDTKTSCTIGGSETTPNPTDFTDPANLPLPITAAQITDWENEAAAGGVISGDYILTNGLSASLGPKKISGNLTLDNNAILTVTGTLWITGQIKLSNGAVLKLDPSYGSLSGVVVAGIGGDASAGYIEIDNNSNALGSGTAGSYTLLLSQRNNSSSIAIKASNNATGAILYAGTGVIELDNNSGLKEVTAYKIHLKNNAIVTYESGLANAQFTSGAGGSWAIEKGTWRETN